MSQQQKERPVVIKKEERTPRDDSEDEFDDEMVPPPEMMAQVLDGVLSNYLMHVDEPNQVSYNVADVLMQVKTSLDKNSKCVLKLEQSLAALVTAVNQIGSGLNGTNQPKTAVTASSAIKPKAANLKPETSK